MYGWHTSDEGVRVGDEQWQLEQDFGEDQALQESRLVAHQIVAWEVHIPLHGVQEGLWEEGGGQQNLRLDQQHHGNVHEQKRGQEQV